MKRFLPTLALVGLAACGPPRRNVIVIGSKNFTEQAILGEILAQQLEARGFHVERRFYLQGTYLCQQAILAGRIDLYVEYTGTALEAILKEPGRGGPQQVFEQVKREYARRYKLDVLSPLGFNNTFALVVRGTTAARDHLKTISEAAPYATHWRPGFGYEFMSRPDGYQGLVKTYALKFGAAPRVMDLGLLYRALISKQVDIVAGNSTDGMIEALGLKILKDDKHYFPPYQAVPVVRVQTLAEHPGLEHALAELGGKISDREMRHMNYEVDGEHESIAQVARKFLVKKGLAAR